MATVKREDLPKRAVKLTIEVPVADMRPFLESAAKELSEQTKIPGFRPGKATYDVVKQRFGEMKIMEAALESIIRTSFVDAMIKEDIDSVGQPKFDVEKMVPDSPLVFTAEVALMPEVTKLADLDKLKTKKEDVKATDNDVQKALDQLQSMQTKEVRGTKDEAAKKEDMMVVDMKMKKDKVPVEGGDAVGYKVFLSEEQYIPGFADEILGLKEGESKTFTLKFPEDHYQKHLAGGDVEFEVDTKELYHLEPPTIDDEFAKSIGADDLETLKKTLRENIQAEKDSEEANRVERAMLEEVAKQSSYTEIPDLLVTQEVNKMLHEFEHSVQSQGIGFEDYLAKINKSIAEIKLDFTPQALERIKVALAMNKIAVEEKIEVTDTDLDDELDKVAAQYEEKEARDQIYNPEYRAYTKGVLRNRKVIAFLLEKIGT